MAMYEVSEQLKSQLQLSTAELEDLKNAFSLFDKNSSGTISYQEFESLANSLGLSKQIVEVEKYVKKSHNSTSEKMIDEIDFSQFLLMTVQRTRKRQNSFQLDSDLREAFSTFDRGTKGFLSANDLKQMMLTLGDNSVTDDDVLEMMKEADVNHDKHISFEEFRLIMGRQLAETD